MIFAIYDFTPFKDELPKFNLKELLNIEDLNNSIFEYSQPHQQEQYISFKKSEEAKKYREDRNIRLPYVDFINLPETLDDILLEKIMVYQKEGEVRDAIFDLISEGHTGQIARFEYKIREEEAKR